MEELRIFDAKRLAEKLFVDTEVFWNLAAVSQYSGLWMSRVELALYYPENPSIL